MQLRKRLAEGEARIDHRIEFHDGKVVDAELVGKNTGFLFYFTTGDTELSIAPLADNVHRVQRINKSQRAAANSAAAEGGEASSPSD